MKSTINIVEETKTNNTSNTRSINKHSMFRTSDDFFKLVVESLEDYAIFTTDTKGIISSWNIGAQRILRYRESEIVGKDIAILFVPEDIKDNAPEKERKTAIEKGRGVDERIHLRKDRTPFWSSGLLFPLKDENGTLRGFTKVMRDLSFRKLMEEERKKIYDSEQKAYERLELAQEIGKIGTFEWIINKNTILWTAQLKAIYGIKSEVVTTTYDEWMNHIYVDDREDVNKKLRASLKGTSKFNIEFRVLWPDQTIHWIFAQGKVLYDKNKVPERMVGVNIDISERKQTENNLKFMAEASKVLSSSLDYQETLNKVASLAVPHIADWCSIEMLESDGKLVQVALAHKDPEKIKWAKKLREEDPPDMNATTGLPNVLRTSKSEIYPYISDEMLVATAKSKKQLKLIRSIGLTSVMIVPLCSNKKCVGAINFVNTESRRQYNKSDLIMAEELASRAFLAVDNATLYQSAQTEIEERKRAEENFRNLAETIPQQVWISSPDGVIEYYNRRWYDYTGLTIEDVTKKHIKFIHPDDSERASKLWRQSLATGKPYETEYRMKNGKTHNYQWFLGRALPIKNKKGSIIKWFGTSTDINEQKSTQEALQRSEAQFKALYDANIVGVMYGDLKGTIFEANDAFLTMIGYTRKELSAGNVKWTSITPQEYKEIDTIAINELKSTRFTKPWEKEFVRKDGSQIPVIMGAVLLDKDTNETISIVLDITERKKLEQRKDEFIGIASHELKTPLTSIKGYTQILERIIEQMGDDKLKLYLKKTNIYIDRLNSLISDLLDVSKIQAGKLQMNPTEIDFDDLVDDGVESIQHINLQHKVIRKGRVNQVIVGDKHRLEQVFTNLLSNAIKYSPEAEKVIVTITKDDENVQVAVADYGVGIAKSKQTKIFERFYRVDSTSNKFSGLGIGLYISCEIVSRHGGKIWVKSREGRGSTFYFSLPIKGQILTVEEKKAHNEKVRTDL